MSVLESFYSSIDLSMEFATYWLYAKRDEEKYSTFRIRKKNPSQYREITAPHSPLLHIQYKFKMYLEAMENCYRPYDCVTGFVLNKSIKDNANKHKNKKIVVNIDIQDFFPSITFSRVYGMLKGAPYNIDHSIAAMIAHGACCNNNLAQGSPLSPLLSNMICKSLDRAMMQFAKDNHLYYSSYADDITLSTIYYNCGNLFLEKDEQIVLSEAFC